MTQVALSKSRLRDFVKLHQKKFRDSKGLFLAEGLRTVRELCMNLPDEEMLVALLIREGEADVARFAQTYKGKVFSVTEKEGEHQERGGDALNNKPTLTTLGRDLGTQEWFVAASH